MTVRELIQHLQQCDPEAPVYVDWDREGGNENLVEEVMEGFDPHIGHGPGVKIK